MAPLHGACVTAAVVDPTHPASERPDGRTPDVPTSVDTDPLSVGEYRSGAR